MNIEKVAWRKLVKGRPSGETGGRICWSVVAGSYSVLGTFTLFCEMVADAKQTLDRGKLSAFRKEGSPR